MSKKENIKKLIRHVALAAGLASAFAVSAPAVAQVCEVSRPVVFANLDWDANGFHMEVAKRIVEAGYGCRTDHLSGSTLPMFQGMVRGDIDVTMETWLSNLSDVYDKAVADGKVVQVGVNYDDAKLGWYVPRYLIEGDAKRHIPARAPDLKSVFDLPKYKALFRDPEEPQKGRFYNGILGWTLEATSTRKLQAYGLNDSFTNFHSGTGAALDAAISSAYERGRPIVFAYWGPTWILGKYDMVMLEEPPFDKEKWARLINPRQSPEGAGVAFPDVSVLVVVSKKFHQQAPKLVDFLSKYRTSNKLTSDALAYMQANKGVTAKDAALHFLKTRQDIWEKWIPADVAARVKASL
ncbi:ABC transporter substrate-binding protein [Oxalobacter vibrioformis]|uniref:ABC transporter substrate-binding protein n=1 Tax=Oxalobacter vibrioformis TaxID=933080 RepID=A0A9E9P2T8_9BURK|nr:ABC transporter substrate-binding protein [Oxalobacter vibrioformis]WAW09358.1 ABC transporter substrate-binding protein [Oxalobacter vibrioformis]